MNVITEQRVEHTYNKTTENMKVKSVRTRPKFHNKIHKQHYTLTCQTK